MPVPVKVVTTPAVVMRPIMFPTPPNHRAPSGPAVISDGSSMPEE